MPEENIHLSPEMEQVYKDFSIIHADAERALNLLRMLEQKIDKEIKANPPDPGDGDRFYQLYALRSSCFKSAASMLYHFEKTFIGQDILKQAGKAIANEGEGFLIPAEWIANAELDRAAEEGFWEEERKNWEEEKATLEEEMRTLKALVNPSWSELVEEDIKQTVEKLAEALGVEERVVSGENCRDTLIRLKGIVQCQNFNKQRRSRFLDQAFKKMQLIVVPLLHMALATNSIDEDGNENEDKETLIQAALEILEQALKLTRGFEE